MIMQQSEKEDPKSHFSLILSAAVAILLCYPLSIGPAVKLTRRYPGTFPVARVLYRPLGLAVDRCEPLAHFLNWYANLWLASHD